MTQTDARLDTNDMVVIHSVFRGEFGLAPTQVRAVPDADTVAAARLVDHLRLLSDFLHGHHHGEDELLWPALLAKAQVPAEVVDRMQMQHDALATVAARLPALLDAWGAGADVATRDELADTLERVHADLVVHLDEEETELLPLVAAYLSAAEWNRLAEHGRGSMSTRPDLAMRQLGMILEDADEHERVAFLAPMPPPARQAWLTIGLPKYERYTAELRAAR